MSILWEFQASHKLGPSKSITCEATAMSGNYLYHMMTYMPTQVTTCPTPTDSSFEAYHDIEIPLLAFVMHLWQSVHITQVSATQEMQG